MPWGTIELEAEVEEWLLALLDGHFGQAERYIDLLAEEGVHLGEPFTRQLRGKLRELRFHLGGSKRGPLLRRHRTSDRALNRLLKDAPTGASRG